MFLSCCFGVLFSPLSGASSSFSHRGGWRSGTACGVPLPAFPEALPDGLPPRFFSGSSPPVPGDGTKKYGTFMMEVPYLRVGYEMQWACKFPGLLLHDDEEILLLTLLCQDVFPVEEVGIGDFAVKLCQFFLVDAHASALGEFAHLAL